MKRIIVPLILLVVVLLTLFSCDKNLTISSSQNTELTNTSQKEKVFVTFSGMISEIKKEFPYGTVIPKDSLYEKEGINPIEISMFYDDNYTIPYKNEPIYENTTIYVKYNIIALGDNELEVIKNKYYEEFKTNIPSICYGKFGNSYVFFEWSQLMMVSYFHIYDYTLYFSTFYRFAIYKNGVFYRNEEDIKKYNLLTEEDAETIYNIHLVVSLYQKHRIKSNEKEW